MIGFRCFRNDDPPRLADVWRTAEVGPGGFQPMTAAWLEACVFSKPFFDREGLTVAVDGERVVGFAHAAFGPAAGSASIDPAIGTTILVIVVPHEHHDGIATGLLARSEDYLRSRGATTILGGGTPRVGGLYLGLYGGSDLPGILDSSPCMQDVFRRAGYVEAERIAVMRRSLAGYRPPVTRSQIAMRRATTVRVVDEPARRTWWEAATTTGMALRRYELRDDDGTILCSGTFWDVQPLATSWGVHAAGLLDVEVAEARRRRGYASHLLAEALHDLAQEGVALAETHVPVANENAVRLLSRIGFEAAGHGTVFRRP